MKNIRACKVHLLKVRLKWWNLRLFQCCKVEYQSKLTKNHTSRLSMVSFCHWYKTQNCQVCVCRHWEFIPFWFMRHIAVELLPCFWLNLFVQFQDDTNLPAWILVARAMKLEVGLGMCDLLKHRTWHHSLWHTQENYQLLFAWAWFFGMSEVSNP